MKKGLALTAAIVGGAIATAVIDAMLGVNMIDYDAWQTVGHKIAYMAQGVAVLWAINL